LQVDFGAAKWYLLTLIDIPEPNKPKQLHLVVSFLGSLG
jgi:hypothetical protein